MSADARLEQARRDLLDLGLRNPLLNYRTLSARGLEIVDERPAQVFEILVRQERPMSFLPLPDSAAQRAAESDDDSVEDLLVAALEAEGPSEDEDTGDGVPSRHKDTKLQTPHPSARLQRRLLNTQSAARLSIEEQGVNTLFLALGTLEWYENESSDTRRCAPLLLVPVELYRTSVRANFRLKYTGDEVGANLSLQAKLKQEFGIELPGLPAIEDVEFDTYCRSVAEAVSDKHRWAVDPDKVALGFFSFAKFLMYKDLDPEAWPEGQQPSEHVLIQALLTDEGFSDPEPQVTEQDNLDDHLDLAEVFQIRDADSSQTLAILDVHQGRNVVIQGPPGTGKSQTIANLVAEAVARGRKVLFVAEKMAALEVVKRRLDQDGVGDACLELHSNKTNKRDFLEELRRTLQLGKPQVNGFEDSLAELSDRRDRLNDYSRAVNTPMGDTGTSPHQAFGSLLQLSRRFEGVSLPAQALESDFRNWSRADLRQRVGLAGRLQALLRDIGQPSEHLFWGSERKTFLPKDRQILVRSCEEAVEYLGTLLDACAELKEMLPPVEVCSLRELEQAVRAVELLANRPNLDGVAVDHVGWAGDAHELGELLADVGRLNDIHQEYADTLIPEAWEQDVLVLRGVFATIGTKWWRLLSGRYRAGLAKLKALTTGSLPESNTQRLALVDAILEAKRLLERILRREALLGDVFGSQWRGENTRWPRLIAIAGWLNQAHDALAAGNLPETFLELARAGLDLGKLSERAEAARRARTDYVGSVERIGKHLELGSGAEVIDRAILGRDLQDHKTRLQDWIEHAGSLNEIVSYNHLASRMQEEDMGDWVEVAGEWPHSADYLADLVQYAWFNNLVEDAMEERDILAGFHGQTHREILSRFCELDRDFLRVNRARVASAHWEGIPRTAAGGQMGVLLREFEKKRRHLPIRQVMIQAGNVVQQIKPLFMMSPLSVATYLPPQSVEFDLAIFDEASQVRPVDALGAILRAGQAIVVGDSKQLPPTSFFDKIAEGDDDDEESVVTSDMESILGLFRAQGAPERMLRWHYRSRHDSLIAVSNYEFYDNKLVVFPSPDSTRDELGVVFHHLPHTTYEPGGRRRYNRGEAEAVARAVMKHSRSRPDLTLGVAAFSQAQARAIEDQVELARREDPSLEGFFNGHPEEPFFVKNLENVQGDERDVIFISVGYGKRKDGYLSMNFGPLNRDGGERRLNVLVTRAKRRCEVFSNFTAADVDLNRTNSRGVVAFKRYLKYAETGLMDVPQPAGRGADSVFEEEVADRLREVGYEVQHQVGSGGFFIDLAVVDSERRGRYVLGIECDGATYHSARWARDRDRLRQQVLEGLGWHIHRVWSTDWFRNPDAELRRVAEALERAKACRTAPAPTPAAPTTTELSDPFERESGTEPVTELPALKRYECVRMHEIQFQLAAAGLDLHEVASNHIADWVAAVVKVESPLHELEVAQRIVEGAALKRKGSRIVAAVECGIQNAAARGLVRRKGTFLWNPAMDQPTPRDRSGLPPASRQIDRIAPEEIGAAVSIIVSASLGIQRDEAIREAGRMLGFGRVTEGISDVIGDTIACLVDSGELALQGDYLVQSEGRAPGSA